MKNLIIRALTGIIYVVIVTGGVLINSWTFLILFSVITFLCLWEFYGLVNQYKGTDISRVFNCLGGSVLFVATFLFASGITNYTIFLLYLLYIIIVFVAELYRKKEDPLKNLAFSFLGQLYIALPYSILNFLGFIKLGSGDIYYPLLILSLFVFIWINDSGAYLTGMAFGKHKMFPRISPKKSWEGFAGGVFLTIGAAWIFAYFEPVIPVYHWMAMALVIIGLGTWGDLIESLMKRTLGVKDSGKVLPGHGGFLDRFDSLLFAIYGQFIYVELFIRN